MNGRHNRAAQALDNVHKLQLVGDIQMVGRLVQNQAGGLLGQCPSQNHPLLLAAGKGGEAALCHIGHANRLQRLGHNGIVLGIVPLHGPLVGRATHKHHILHGKFKIIIVVLGQDRNGLSALLIRELPDIRAVQLHNTGLGLQNPVDALEQRALAAAIGADDAHKFIGFHLQRNTPENGVAAQNRFNVLCLQFHPSPPPNP